MPKKNICHKNEDGLTAEEELMLNAYAASARPPSLDGKFGSLITKINEGVAAHSFSDVMSFLSSSCSPQEVSKYSQRAVVLANMSISAVESHYKLLPAGVSSAQLDRHGATNTDITWMTGGARHLGTLNRIKTSLFKAMLLIGDGAEAVALQMMIIAPGANFENNTDALKTPAFCIAVSQGRYQVAKKLIERPAFSLRGYDVMNDGTKVSIVEMVAQRLNAELVEAMGSRIDLDGPLIVYKHPSVSHATLLMLCAERGNIDAVRALIPRVNVSCSVENKHSGAERVNALSFAAKHEAIVEMLIKAGCPFSGITIGLITPNSLDIIPRILGFAKKIEQLLKEQSFYKKAAEAFAQDGKDASDPQSLQKTYSTLREQREKDLQLGDASDEQEGGDLVVSSAVERAQPKASIEETDIDLLLLHYFATADAGEKTGIEGRISELCEASTEATLKIISTLNTRYLDHPNVTEFVHNLLQDPKAVHRYFEARKDIVTKQIQQHKFDGTSVVKFWDLQSGERVAISDEGVIKVASSMAHSLYIKIASGLRSLVNVGLENLKVLTGDSHGQNGVKFLVKQGIAELKTKALGDTRLVAKGVHVNTDGDMLLYFSESMNHEEVARYKCGVVGEISEDIT